MTKSARLGLLALAAVASGCGGFVGPKTATITGTVLDLDNNPVRGAQVWTVDSSGVSSTTGAYVLTANRPGEVKVTSEITKDGLKYRGSNWALNFDNEQTQNVNIVLGPVASNGKITGTVRDRQGLLLENVAVYAYSGAGSASRDFTNSDGRYTLEDVLSGVTYSVSATARTYRSDDSSVTLADSEVRTLNLVLDDPGLPSLDAPTNLDAVTWVSPTDPTRAPTTGGDPYLAIKQKLDPRYKAGGLSSALTRTATRALQSNLIVETDLFWDEFRHADLLGYAIYRSPGNTTSMNYLDFSPDPLSAYYVDIGPNVNSVYSYAVSSLATLYPDFPNTESDLSDVVVAETLDKLDLLSVSQAPLTFRWLSGSGGEEFYVFLFDRFPGIGVDWIWDNLATPAFGTSYAYDGPGLAPGQTYYYLVLGSANGGASRTISQIGSFQA